VRAANIYGYGDYSPVTTIQAAQEPGLVAPASLSTVEESTDVRLAWSAPAANNDPITAYRVEILQKDGGYAEELTHCNGADATIVASATCIVPFTVLRASPYLLVQGDAVRFTVAAYNVYGWGATSQLNYVQVATIQTEPAAPSAPVYEPLSSTASTATFSWAGITAGSFETGGSAILSYNLQMKAGASTVWTEVHGQQGAYSTALTATATGLTTGETYTFRLRAANLHGWGTYSTEVPIVVSGVPDKPAAPSTALVSLHVNVSWTAPADNSATITAYRIKIKNSVGTYLEETTNCDASVDPIFSQRFCLVPMTHLRSSYGLALGTLVEVTVTAYNRNGWGAEGDPNTAGTTVQTEPG
jgi:hypothetical protein